MAANPKRARIFHQMIACNGVVVAIAHGAWAEAGLVCSGDTHRRALAVENDGPAHCCFVEDSRLGSQIYDPRTKRVDQVCIDAGRVDESAPTYALTRRRTTDTSDLQT